MEKLLLIDGNSMLFRAYYATVYGQSMTSQSGIPTNAIFGFALMLSKAIKTIEPEYVVVAFDHDKDTYRHLEYEGYKGTRSATPDDLKIQFPIIREYLDSLHIVHHEQSKLEADDIIGCLAKQNKEYQVNILTSDKDLLQLVDDEITVWLMHKGITDIVKMDEAAVYERFQLKPEQIVDLKGLAGDSSDNIPGVNKVGDKTAIKLLSEFGTVENLYEHIDEVKGKLKENLVNDKDNAFLSKHLAKIITDEKIDIDISKCHYQPEGEDAYNFYSKYNMRSLADKVEIKEKPASKEETYKKRSFGMTSYVSEDSLTDRTVIYYDRENKAFSIVNEKVAYNMSFSDFFNSKEIRNFVEGEKCKIFYDIKDAYHLFDENGMKINGKNIDLMIMAFLCDCKIKNVNDLLMKYHLPLQTKNEQLDLFDTAADVSVINETADKLLYLCPTIENDLQQKDMVDLYWKMEFPLAEVLFDMEKTGIRCEESILDKIAVETNEKIEVLQKSIYQLAGKEFNINSPKQLAEIIYDDLKLARSTKRSTDAKVLSKMADTHPIINEILEYRKYAKIYSTYAKGLQKYIAADGKIHTIYNQCIAETGRLTSSEPNLQNISVRNEEASMIRKAFLADEGCVLVGADYSQVELRIMAHLANEENLINAFKDGYDIHTKTAMDIFNVEEKGVTSEMRRQAKAINFGIDYGMSVFGLSEQLSIPVSMASQFINAYYQKYPRIREYMNETIEFCQKNGYVTTMFNRRRDIAEINSSNHNLKEFGKRAAMNAPIQGSAADLMKIAMINVYNKLNEKGYKAKMILQIHDEMILNVPVEEEKEVMELVEREMENALTLQVPLVAKATSGTTWLEVK